jgi:hypothetical protein
VRARLRGLEASVSTPPFAALARRVADAVEIGLTMSRLDSAVPGTPARGISKDPPTRLYYDGAPKRTLEHLSPIPTF